MAKRKKYKEARICNICGLPEPHTKDVKMDECVGHNGIRPCFWNLHPDNREK